jgi:lysine-specific demethylase 8
MRTAWAPRRQDRRDRRDRHRALVSLDNVERVPHLDPDQLDERYLRRGRPVILTSLFDGSQLRALSGSVSDVRSVLPHVSLPYGPNPVQAAVLGRAAAPDRQAPFGKLYDQFDRGALPGQICAEHELPTELAALVPPLPHLRLGHPADRWRANIFLSAAGNATHLHFDKDLRHDLIHQVLGRKRYVLIDAARTAQLAPCAAPDAAYASNLFLDRLPASDLLDFVRSTGGYDCVLEPGETLVLPATLWHYVAYVETALSVHFRLARNRPLLRLAEAAAGAGVGTVDVQSLAVLLLDEAQVTGRVERVLDDLEALVREASRGSHRDRRLLRRRFLARCILP